MMDAWDQAMRGLSDLELELIMVGAKRGTLKAVGDPGNAIGAGIKAGMELARRNAMTARNALMELAERQNGGPLPKPKPWRANAWWHYEIAARAALAKAKP